MNLLLEQKYTLLKEYLQDLEEVVIAYTGCLGSHVLLKVANDVLQDEVIALVARSKSVAYDDFNNAVSQAREAGVDPIIIDFNQIKHPKCSQPKNECAICKKHKYNTYSEFIEKYKLLHLLDSSYRTEDLNFGPCTAGFEELDILTPFHELGFTEEDIMDIAEELEINTLYKEAISCISAQTKQKHSIDNKIDSKIELA